MFKRDSHLCYPLYVSIESRALHHDFSCLLACYVHAAHIKVACASLSPTLLGKSFESITKDFKTATILPFTPPTQLMKDAVDSSIVLINSSSVSLHSVTLMTFFKAGIFSTYPSLYFYRVQSTASSFEVFSLATFRLLALAPRYPQHYLVGTSSQSEKI